MSLSAGEARPQIVPGISTIREAQKFLAKYLAATRLIPAPFLSQTVGKNVYLKLETELPNGSFKVRGALWALAQRLKRGPVQEVVACSTGNHGAAVAYAAKEFGIKARIFLPANCNPVKRGRIVALGAAITESEDSDPASAFALVAEYAKEPGVFFLNDASDEDSRDQRDRCADGRYGADSRDRSGGEADRAESEDYRRAGGGRPIVLPVVEDG